MAKIDDLLSQLNLAARDLRQQVIEIDRKILTSQKARDELTSAPVSKSDFLNYLKIDIQRKYEGSNFLQQLGRRLGSVSREFGALESATKGAGLNISYATGDQMIPVPISDSAVFFYFEDIILGRISSLIDGGVWPEYAIPVEERKALIAGFDAQIISYKQDRKKLTDQLISAGLQG